MDHPDKETRDSRILSERARHLAIETNPVPLREILLDLVEFNLSDETYGIELQYIREIYALKELTPLPGVPPFIPGIINVRGTIVSVVDLKQFFGLAETTGTNRKQVIILCSQNMEFGVIADRIIGVRKLPKSDIQPPIPTLSGIRARYLKGIIDGKTAILDGRKLLEDEQMQMHSECEF